MSIYVYMYMYLYNIYIIYIYIYIYVLHSKKFYVVNEKGFRPQITLLSFLQNGKQYLSQRLLVLF